MDTTIVNDKTLQKSFTRSTKISDVISDEAFGDFGRLIFPVNSNSKSTDNMKDMSTLTFTEQQAAAITAIACNEARGDQAPVISPSEWPLGNPNTAYAQYFIGNSYLAVLDNGLCNVTSNPVIATNGWNL